MGYAHLVLYDHLLGADPGRPGGWRGPYPDRDPLEEVGWLTTPGGDPVVTLRSCAASAS